MEDEEWVLLMQIMEEIHNATDCAMIQQMVERCLHSRCGVFVLTQAVTTLHGERVAGSEAETESLAPGVAPSFEVDGCPGAGDGPPPQCTSEARERRPTGTEDTSSWSSSQCPMTKQRLLEGCGRCSSTTLQHRRLWKGSRAAVSRCSCAAAGGRTGPAVTTLGASSGRARTSVPGDDRP